MADPVAATELIQVPKPEIGRPTDRRIDEAYLESRPELVQAGYTPFIDGTDVDIIERINEALTLIFAQVRFASPTLGNGLIGALTNLLSVLTDLEEVRADTEQYAGGIERRDNLAAIDASPDGLYRDMSNGWVYQRAGGVNTRQEHLENVGAAALSALEASTAAGFVQADQTLRSRGPLYSPDYTRNAATAAERASRLQQMLSDGTSSNRPVHFIGAVQDIAPFPLDGGGTQTGLRYGSGQIIQCDPTVWLRWATANTPGMMLGPVAAGVVEVYIYDIGLDQRATTHDGNSMTLSINSVMGARIYRPRGRNVATMYMHCDSPESAPTTDIVIVDPIIENSVGGALSFFSAMADFDIQGGRFRSGADDAIAFQASPRGYPQRIRTANANFSDWNKRHVPGTANPVLSTPHAVLYMGIEDAIMDGHIGDGSVASLFAVLPLAASDTSQDILRRNKDVQLLNLHAIRAGVSDADTTGVPGNGVELRATDRALVDGCVVKLSRQNGIATIDSTGVQLGLNTAVLNGLAGASWKDSRGTMRGGQYNDNGTNPAGANRVGVLVDGGEVGLDGVAARETRTEGERTQTIGVLAVGGAVVEMHNVDARGNITAPTQVSGGVTLSEYRTRTRDGRIYNAGQVVFPANDGGIEFEHGLAAPPTSVLMNSQNCPTPGALCWEIDSDDSGRVLVRRYPASANSQVVNWEAWV